MQKVAENIFSILRLIIGAGVFLAPGLLVTWIIFVVFFPDTLRRYEMSLLEELVYFAFVIAIAYFSYKATPWRKVMDFVSPLYLYDEWLGGRGE